MKLNKREKLLLILVIVFGIILMGKSLTEGYKPTSETPASEVAFEKWALEEADTQYDGTLYQKGVLSIKLISIKERNQEGEDYYIAKFRKYLLNVIPFSDVYIKEEKGKFIEES